MPDARPELRMSSVSERFDSAQDPPPAMAFEISEAGIAAARIGPRGGAGVSIR